MTTIFTAPKDIAEICGYLRQGSKILTRVAHDIPKSIPQGMVGYSSLTEYLDSVIGTKHTDKAINAYLLGRPYNEMFVAPSKRPTILWRFNPYGIVVGGNVISFDEKGNVINRHGICRSESCSHYYLGVGLFGANLLNVHKTKRVYIVCDELTAVLGSVACPQHLWLSVGFGENLTSEHLRLLNSRSVTLLPDNAAWDFWCKVPVPHGGSVKISDYLARLEADCEDGTRKLFINIINKKKDEKTIRQNIHVER